MPRYSCACDSCSLNAAGVCCAPQKYSEAAAPNRPTATNPSFAIIMAHILYAACANLHVNVLSRDDGTLLREAVRRSASSVVCKKYSQLGQTQGRCQRSALQSRRAGVRLCELVRVCVELRRGRGGGGGGGGCGGCASSPDISGPVEARLATCHRTSFLALGVQGCACAGMVHSGSQCSRHGDEWGIGFASRRTLTGERITAEEIKAASRAGQPRKQHQGGPGRRAANAPTKKRTPPDAAKRRRHQHVAVPATGRGECLTASESCTPQSVELGVGCAASKQTSMENALSKPGPRPEPAPELRPDSCAECASECASECGAAVAPPSSSALQAVVKAIPSRPSKRRRARHVQRREKDDKRPKMKHVRVKVPYLAGASCNDTPPLSAGPGHVDETRGRDVGQGDDAVAPLSTKLTTKPGTAPGANLVTKRGAKRGASPGAALRGQVNTCAKKAPRRKNYANTSRAASTTSGVQKLRKIASDAASGPRAYTREELETFTREQLRALKKEQQQVQTLHAEILALQERAAGMTARHMIHARRDVERQARLLREKSEEIESGKHINDFCREAAAFFYTFDRLRHAELGATQTEIPTPTGSARDSARDGAGDGDVANEVAGGVGSVDGTGTGSGIGSGVGGGIGVGSARDVARSSAVGNNKAHGNEVDGIGASMIAGVPSTIHTFRLAENGLVQTVGCHMMNNHHESDQGSAQHADRRDASAPRVPVLETTKRRCTSVATFQKQAAARRMCPREGVSAEELITREQVPMLVVPDTLDDMLHERQRQIARPEFRMLAGGKSSSCFVADEFLEKHGVVEKPLCVVSDETCAVCGIGKLALDTESDVLVCEHCRSEQASTHANDRSAGYGSVQTFHFSTCRYRRTAHFTVHLDRFSGCVGSSKITNKVVFKIMQGLAAKGVVEVDVGKVEEVLKQLGLNKLVNHKVVITAIITGIRPPSFSPEERHQLIDMFIETDGAFLHLKRTGQLEDRLNALNYTCMIFKFCQLLAWGHKYLTYFRLLRGPDKLAKQDRLWKKICQHLGFQYIKSEARVQ